MIDEAKGHLFRRIHVVQRVTTVLCNLRKLAVGDMFEYLLHLVIRRAQDEDLADLKEETMTISDIVADSKERSGDLQ